MSGRNQVKEKEKYHISKVIFSQKLLSWYHKNKRIMPWRGESDPYKIWVSEVILQQTRVNQGWEYYNRFISQFPSVKELSKASEEEVLKLWEGLGYYTRARNLHYSARKIVRDFGGRFPDTYEEILSLKGVGEYTAAAIASIAFHLPYVVVDGNVLRVISRLFMIRKDVSDPNFRKEIRRIAEYYLNSKNPGDFNQALMELGATVCLPFNPKCTACCFQKECISYKKGVQKELPVKNKTRKEKERYFNYLIITDKKNNIYFQQRKENDIWKGLYEPFLTEEKNNGELARKKESVFKKGKLITTKPIVHVLSHQKIIARAWVVEKSCLRKNFIDRIDKTGKFYSEKEIKKLPVSVLVRKIMNIFYENTHNPVIKW